MTRVLAQLQLKVFTDNSFIFASILQFILERLENNVGKNGGNAGYQHFLLFSQCFNFEMAFPQGLQNSSFSVVIG